MKVLVGVDGSSNSFAAVGFVGRLVSPERDALTLLFAVPPLSFDDERLDPGIQMRARAALSRTVLEAALERLPEEWRAKAELREVAESASTAILETIEIEEFELVAVGFRGTSGIIEEFMLGSVSRAIVHSAPIPVLVVKSGVTADEPANRSPGPLTKHMHVLVACDGTPLASRIAAVLDRLSWPEETRGWVLTVAQPMFIHELPDWVKIERDPDVAAMASAWQQEHQANINAARADLEKFRDMLPDCFAKEEPLVVEGRPAEEILKQIRALAIDLAVVGSGGSGTVRRLLLGSTSEQVLREAPCSVLVVR
jgi:nucleotide-binding universal stress UspA family protein